MTTQWNPSYDHLMTEIGAQGMESKISYFTLYLPAKATIAAMQLKQRLTKRFRTVDITVKVRTIRVARGRIPIIDKPASVLQVTFSKPLPSIGRHRLDALEELLQMTKDDYLSFDFDSVSIHTNNPEKYNFGLPLLIKVMCKVFNLVPRSYPDHFHLEPATPHSD